MIRRLLKEALWAPVAVLAAAMLLTRRDARELYWLLHVAGGAAVAFFFLRAIEVAAPLIGALRPLARYIAAFLLACSAALAWELGEFAVDQFFGTRLQEGLLDTMTDLAFGVSGAALFLALASFTGRSEGQGGR